MGSTRLTAQDTHHEMKQLINTIPDRPSPGITRTAPTVSNQDRGDKLTTGNHGIRIRNNVIIGTWNVRTLNGPGKLAELTHELKRYTWHIIGISEMRWKGTGEISTFEGHKVFYSGMEDKHEQGVRIIVHENITKSVIGFQAISSRILVLRLKATPFNVTIIQAPTTEYSDQEIETFYDKIQNVIQHKAKKDIFIVQGDWNSKVSVDAHKVWEGTCGINCNKITNDRGLRLLEFASSNELIIANTYGKHKESRRWTWHSPNHAYYNQIDYILTKRRFQVSIYNKE